MINFKLSHYPLASGVLIELLAGRPQGAYMPNWDNIPLAKACQGNDARDMGVDGVAYCLPSSRPARVPLPRSITEVSTPIAFDQISRTVL
jgi:hypothetical protein